MRHKGKLLMSLFIGTIGLIALPATAARADTVTPLTITNFYQIVPDTARGHLFISEGSSANSIVVTDLAGNEVATIGGQDGAMGLALSPDGSTLYAALASDHAVSAIDTTTLQQTAAYPIGDANTPRDVAVQSGKVWVSYDTGTVGSAAIGDIDLTAITPAFETQAAMGGWFSAPDLAADPQDSGVLVADNEVSTAAVASYDVSVDPVTVRAQSSGVLTCGNAMDLAVVPGGSQFILACNSNIDYVYSTADLSQQGSYGNSTSQDAVAIAAAGTVGLGTANNPSSPDVYVYQAGGSTPLNTYQVGGSSINLMPRGLAWSADGSRLFGVIQYHFPNTTATYALYVLYPPRDSSILTMSGPNQISLQDNIPITGLLAVSGGTLPSGSTITITRTLAGSSDSQQYTVPVASDGRFALLDTPPGVGTYTYAASYGGDSDIAPASGSFTMIVIKANSALSLSGPSTVQVTTSISLTGTLSVATGSLPAGTTVTVTRTLFGSTDSQQFTVTPAADGSFSLSDTPLVAGTYTYTASYSGTTDINPATAAQTVSVTPLPTSLTVATGGTTFDYDSTIHVTAHLGTTDTNRTVSIYAQPFGSTAKTLLKTGTVDSNGNLAVSYLAPHSTTFSAVFTGDAQYAPMTVAQAVSIRARVTLAISGYYASKLISGTTYRIYHHTARLGTAVTVAPNKRGQCLKLEIQEYYQGAWHVKVITGCGHLNGSSMGSWALAISQAHLNSPYRIRADYIRSSTDTSNLSNDSGWQYFIVVK